MEERENRLWVVTIVVLAVLVLAEIALAQAPPGSPMNPLRCRPDAFGALRCEADLVPSPNPRPPTTKWGDRPPTTGWGNGQGPAPGTPLNPIRCRPTWGGGTECSSDF